jgi:hypothetical protein
MGTSRCNPLRPAVLSLFAIVSLACAESAFSGGAKDGGCGQDGASDASRSLDGPFNTETSSRETMHRTIRAPRRMDPWRIGHAKPSCALALPGRSS